MHFHCQSLFTGIQWTSFQLTTCPFPPSDQEGAGSSMSGWKGLLEGSGDRWCAPWRAKDHDMTLQPGGRNAWLATYSHQCQWYTCTLLMGGYKENLYQFVAFEKFLFWGTFLEDKNKVNKSSRVNSLSKIPLTATGAHLQAQLPVSWDTQVGPHFSGS